jgi:hypothetical protein
MEISMFNSKSLKGMTMVAAGSLVLLMSGCNTPSQQREASYNHGERFVPDGTPRETQQLAQTMAASGARNDDTLYTDHFDGAGLSSLGTSKLDLVLDDSHSCNPLVVYLAIPNDDLGAMRRRAVGTYLIKHGGLKPEQLVFEFGNDPASLHPATIEVANYGKTDTAAQGGGGYGTSSSGAGH